jgi:hypothetical protein
LFVTEHGALPVALAKAKTIVLTVTTLPTSLLVDDDLKTWARAAHERETNHSTDQAHRV